MSVNIDHSAPCLVFQVCIDADVPGAPGGPVAV